jgi:1-acyl-sn-glycerol-3-phosphate acyltransferase
MVRGRPPLLYRVLAVPGGPLARLLFRPRVASRELVPVGGFVLASNHLSGFDSLALAYALYPRALRSMAKVQLFERPLLGPLVRGLGAFPARGGRDADGAVATSARLAGAGHPVVVFPTGARRRRDREHRPRTGAARAALQGGVPLVPAAIRGTDGWRRLRRWHVAFGPAVRLDALPANEAHAAREATTRLSQAIAELEAALDQGAGSGTTGPRTASGSS